MNHIAHLRNTYMQSYDYTIMLIRRNKILISLLIILIVLYLLKLESPSPKHVLCQMWLKLAIFLKRIMHLFANSFLNNLFLISNLSLHAFQVIIEVYIKLPVLLGINVFNFWRILFEVCAVDLKSGLQSWFFSSRWLIFDGKKPF